MARKVLHIVTQAHIDPAWLWEWRDGCAEALTTMQSALDRLRENPDLRFSRSSAITYRWAKEMDPRLFAEIQARIDEGCWEVVNGWIEQPDCNIPSTESFVRHALYGKRFLQRETGADVTVGYNPDSFGHAGGLPQILAKSGYRCYAFMRPQPHEMDLPLLFWWESRDGSRVLTWRIPRTYCLSADPTHIESEICTAASENFAPGFDHGCIFVGLGNHGGGPTKLQIAKIRDLQRDDSLPELRFSTMAEYFAAVEASPAYADIPTVRSELQMHAVGCYSAMGEVKALNRRAEQSLVRAETLSVIAGLDRDYAYPGDAIEQAWWQTLFNQFHDILAGTSLPQCYEDARDSYGAACDTADQATARAVHTLARRVNTEGAPGGVLFAMNPLPWPRRALIQTGDIPSVPHEGGGCITHLQTHDGEKIPIQWCASDSVSGQAWGFWKLTAAVDLPACGYRAFHMVIGDPPSAEPIDAPDPPTIPIGLVVLDDKSDTWGHDIVSYRDVIGRPEHVTERVVEDGPLVITTRRELKWRDSTIFMDVSTYAHTPVIGLNLRLDWREKGQILKLEVPTSLADVRNLIKTAGGVTERDPNGHEEPCHDWVALKGTRAGSPHTVAILNDRTYSYDCLDGLFRTVLVRSVPFAYHHPVGVPTDLAYPYLDQGWQERRFWLLSRSAAWTDLNLDRLAAELQNPPEYMVDSGHPGTEPWEQEYLSIAPDSVSVTAIKWAEDGDGLVIRLQEMRGSSTLVHVQIPSLGLDCEVPVQPWEIKSLRVRRTSEGAAIEETDLIERPL